MRRLLPLLVTLLLTSSACANLAQQQDTLAPRVPSPEPASGVVGAIAPATASAPAAPSSSAATGGAAVFGSPSAQAAGEASSSSSAAGQSAPLASAPSQASASQPAVASSSASGQGSEASARPSTIASPAGQSPPASATAAPSAPAVKILPTASQALLGPMSHEYETWNNCAPVTSEMVLSYYGIHKTQAEIAPILRPSPKNFSVRMDQIAAYLEQYGLETRPLIGGSLAEIKALVSNNIPVVTEDQLSLQDDYGHFRVARGFDDASGVIIFGDSYYGPTNRISYALYQELWKRHNYGFMPVYRPEQRALVQAILGADFDPAQNLQQALAAAQQAANQHADDGFAWLNLGSDLFSAGQLADAQSAWEHAKPKVTARTLWYTIWPAAVYNRLGNYQQALNVVAIPLASDPNNAEALLQRGNAERGLGKTAQARSDYSLAVDVDPSLAPARQALQSLA